MKPVVSSHTQLCFHFCTWEPPPHTLNPPALSHDPLSRSTPAKGSLGPQEEGGREGKMSAVPGAPPLER